VASFEVEHHDPCPLARTAAVRSRVEADSRTRTHALALTPAERLKAGFELSRFAARVHAAARG
jgi:hypothetical protein